MGEARLPATQVGAGLDQIADRLRVAGEEGAPGAPEVEGVEEDIQIAVQRDWIHRVGRQLPQQRPRAFEPRELVAPGGLDAPPLRLLP